MDDWKTCRNFAVEYSRKYVFIMATVVLQVPDESLVSKVKSACKMLVGVTSVKVLSKREKSDACIESSEREATRRNVKVQKSTPKVDDITKTAHYKELWMMSRMDVFITPIVSMTCLNKFLANVQY